ncbi:MAG: hypothetical protein GY774_16460 [Planctomycetes bacterium]|nr:hypothetical protein [Planctomycetota bacterium]
MGEAKTKQLRLTVVKMKVFNAGYTQSDLISLTALNRQEVSNALNGDRFVPAHQKIIAKVIGMDEKDLFGSWHWSKQKRRTRLKKKK